MIRTTLFPGRYVQGAGATSRLEAELIRYGAAAFLLVDPFVAEALLPSMELAPEGKVRFVTETFGGECSDPEIERLSKAARAGDAEMVVGFGGGKTLDTAKAVAHELGVPVAIVPTIASTDAPCSALSVIYTPEGEVDRYLILPKNPELVLVDTAIIARAPARFLVAGIGDALATWFEAEAARESYSANMSGDLGSATAYALAGLCYDTILEYGLPAKISCEAGVVTPALERVVEANTLLSGLGFESGGLGAAHAIHNGLTELPGSHDAWHGEKVAVGVLASLFLTDKPREVIDQVFDFCLEVGLPTTLAEIGLEGVSDDDLMRVAERSCIEGETIHNEPMPVTPAMVAAALRAADAEGRRRRDAE
jgi:glycerol dehydrogenase